MDTKFIHRFIKETLGDELLRSGFVANKNGIWYRLDSGMLYRFGFQANMLRYDIDPLFYHIYFDGAPVRFFKVVPRELHDINVRLGLLNTPLGNPEDTAAGLRGIWFEHILPDIERNDDVTAYIRNEIAEQYALAAGTDERTIQRYPPPIRELYRGSLNGYPNRVNALIFLREFDTLEKEILKSCVFEQSFAMYRLLRAHATAGNPNDPVRMLAQSDVAADLQDTCDQLSQSLSRILKILPAVQNRDIGALNVHLAEQRAANVEYLGKLWPKKVGLAAWVNDALIY